MTITSRPVVCERCGSLITDRHSRVELRLEIRKLHDLTSPRIARWKLLDLKCANEVMDELLGTPPAEVPGQESLIGT